MSETNVMAAYLRVSTRQQQFVIDAQIKEAQKRAETEGLKLELFIEGVASANHADLNDRPELRKLLAKVEAGEIKNVWVQDPDRLARDVESLNKIKTILTQQKVHLHLGESESYNFDNPADRIFGGAL